VACPQRHGLCTRERLSPWRSDKQRHQTAGRRGTSCDGQSPAGTARRGGATAGPGGGGGGGQEGTARERRGAVIERVQSSRGGRRKRSASGDTPSDRPTARRNYRNERANERERESKAIITAANYIHSVAETTPSAHDTKSYSSVRSKPDKSQLNLPHGTELKSGKEKD